MIERLRMPDGYDIKVKKHDDVYELIMVEYYDKTQDDRLQERFMNTKKLLLVMFPGSVVSFGDDYMQIVYKASKETIMNGLASEFLCASSFGSLSIKELFLAVSSYSHPDESVRDKYLKTVKDINMGRINLSEVSQGGISGSLVDSTDKKNREEKT